MNQSTPFLLTATLLSVYPAIGAEINTTGSDTFGNSSLNTAGVWSNAQAPSSANDYTIAAGHRVRTPADGGSYTFAGSSLTISDGAPFESRIGLTYKGTGNVGIITINNLILDGGSINHLNGLPDIFNLAGTMEVASDSFIYPAQGPINVLSPISGNATITIPTADGPTSRFVTFLSDASTFTGNLVNNDNGQFRLADDAVFNFNIGAPGINNSISGTGISNLINGDFIIDLSGATSMLFDEWSLVTATNVTYGATFTVSGWKEVFPGEWWDPTNTWRFTTADGKLTVAPSWDGDNDGLADLWEDEHFGNGDGNATPTELALQNGTGDGYPIPDGDNLNNLAEYTEGTDPNVADTDGDTLLDGDEVAGASNAFDGTRTEPLKADTDDDGVDDFEENGSLNTQFANAPTNPNKADTDDDGIRDDYELANNSPGTALDPNDNGSSDPTQGPNADRDSDGLSNLAEFKPDEILGNLRPQTRADLADTDDDGFSDNAEDNFGSWGTINTTGTNPTIADTDGDGLMDGDEQYLSISFPGSGVLPTNSDPNVVDTDFDQFSDFYEVTVAGTDPDNDQGAGVPIQANDFVLVEDFEGEGMVIGQTYKNVNGWQSPNNASGLLVADEPIAGGDKVGGFDRPVGDGRLILSKSLDALGLQILDGNSGTLFLQIFTAQAPIDHSFGFSDVPNPGDFADFESQVGMVPSGLIGVRTSDASGGFRPYAGGGYRVGQWMNVWIVSDNNLDVTKVYVQSPDGEVGQVDITSDSGTAPYNFRNGTTESLKSFLMVENIGGGNPVYIDNIYVDPTSVNLSTPVPAKPLPPVTDLKITNFVFNGGDLEITFSPGGAGYILTSSDDLTSPFVEETNATYDGIDTFTVPAEFLNPGKDFFRVETP